MSESDAKNTDFWDYSVQHYSKPGVASCCLALQDRYGLDVNLVLFCIWHGNNFGEFSQTQFDQLLNFSADWSANVVTPVRQARRWLKQRSGSLGIAQTAIEKYREKVKRLELEAERLQQKRLQALAGSVKQPGQLPGQPAAYKNLNQYLQNIGIEQDQQMSELLSIVVGNRGI